MSAVLDMTTEEFATHLDRLQGVFGVTSDTPFDRVLYAAVKHILTLEERVSTLEQCIHLAYDHESESWRDCDNPGCQLSRRILAGQNAEGK